MVIWSMLLTVETWFRSPGSLAGRTQPPSRFELDGVTYERIGTAKGKDVKELPSSAFLTRHWQVGYRRIPIQNGGSARDKAESQPTPSSHQQDSVDLLLADIEATGSGKANRLPIGRVEAWMEEDQGQSGRCVLLDSQGQVHVLEAADPDSHVMVAPRTSGPLRQAAWISGLRAIEDVRCVWVSSTRNLSKSALNRIGTTLLR